MSTGDQSKGPALDGRSTTLARGRSRKRHVRKFEDPLATIERLFKEPVSLTINGTQEKMSTLEAILLRLHSANSVRASKVLHKYRAFADQYGSRRKLEIKFLEDDYTRSLSRPERRR